MVRLGGLHAEHAHLVTVIGLLFSAGGRCSKDRPATLTRYRSYAARSRSTFPRSCDSESIPTEVVNIRLVRVKNTVVGIA